MSKLGKNPNKANPMYLGQRLDIPIFTSVSILVLLLRHDVQSNEALVFPDRANPCSRLRALVCRSRIPTQTMRLFIL